MPKIKFLANWAKEYQDSLKIPKGFLVLKYHDFYRKSIGTQLLKLDEYQKKQFQKAKEEAKKNNGEINDSDFMRDLEIIIEYHYRKRTLDQNALMWSLYTIEANEMNGGMSGSKEQVVIPMELYLSDLEEYGERETITTKRHNLSYYLAEYRIIEAVISGGKEIPIKTYLQMQADDNDEITIRVIRGTSKYNTKEMAKWIDRIFNRIAYHGIPVTNPGEIERYWQEWREYLNDNKITIHDTIMTQEEYKALNPICEACGKFMSDEEKELAHIKAVGMGGDRTAEPKKNYTSNWLCLHANPCHRVYWHQDGIRNFLKQFKHLTYKVNTALARDYKPINDHKQFFQDKVWKIIEEDKKIDSKALEQPIIEGFESVPTTCLECGNKYEGEICPACKGQGLF